MRQVAGFGDRSTARGTFGANLGRAIVTIVRHTCATVSQPSELRFAVVRAVGRGIVVLHGVHVVLGEGEVSGVFVPHFHLKSQTVKCFRFVCDNLTRFPFGKRIVEKLDS